MNFNDLPNDILGMIYDMKEAEQHLEKIEKYSRSNFKFVMKDIKERHFNIRIDRIDNITDDEDILVSDITEDQYLTEDALIYDSKWKYDDMTANIADGYLKFKKINKIKKEFGKEHIKKYYKFH